MATITLDRPAETTAHSPAVALSPVQEDSLILLAASTDKPKKVKAGTPRGQSRFSPSASRAWSLGGNVD